MPHPSYTNAFGLRDNAFGPRTQVPGVSMLASRQLEIKPLQLHTEKLLWDFFAPNAGAFGEHIDDFRGRIIGDGYDPDGRQLGLTSPVSIIGGQEGTGKSTLAFAMIKHLIDCESNNVEWKPFVAKPAGSADKQEKRIRDLTDRIERETKEGDYCYVLIENVFRGADHVALGVHDFLEEHNRVGFLFVMTHDLKVLDQHWKNAPYDVWTYRLRPLTPEQGLEVVKKRIASSRMAGGKVPGYPLFPFEENDILEGLHSGAAEEEGATTMRTLNKTLFRLLRQRQQSLAENYTISTVAPGEIQNQLIKLQPDFESLMKRLVRAA